MISTLSKQGGRRYPQMGSTGLAMHGRLLSVGETTPAPDDEFSASNWQRWRRKRKLEDGDLPPIEQAEAQEAVREAQAAAVEQSRATDADERRDALLRAMEAREAFENAYREAYGEAYVAEIVSELWRKEMRRVERRRKAAILLLH